MTKTIARFDHEDVNTLCKKRQKEYEDCCYYCPLKVDGECKAHLFKERDRLNSIIRETFGNDKYEV